nr:YwbE family protein [Clostridium lacusfryxellense]
MNMQSDNKGQIRSNVPVGTTVDVVLKKDQRTTKLTRGVVKRLLTNSAVHHRGIKVMLEDGQVGRVQAIISK